MKTFIEFSEQFSDKKIEVRPNYGSNEKRNGWQVVEIGEYSDYVFDVWPTKSQAMKAAEQIKKQLHQNKK